MADSNEERLIRRFTEMEVPCCTRCGSEDTASVQVGVIGLTIRLAATCRKFKLIPNSPKPGGWFCHDCGSFFDTPARGSHGNSTTSDGGTARHPPLIRFDFPPGATVDQIVDAIEAMRAKYREEKRARDEAQQPKEE